jgi:hypothetical protein
MPLRKTQEVTVGRFYGWGRCSFGGDLCLYQLRQRDKQRLLILETLINSGSGGACFAGNRAEREAPGSVEPTEPARGIYNFCF